MRIGRLLRIIRRLFCSHPTVSPIPEGREMYCTVCGEMAYLETNEMRGAKITPPTTETEKKR